MRAVILTKPGSIEIREIETPEPSPGELLVQIEAALTCGTDLKAYKRGHPVIPMPGVFGHEFSGTVVKTGKGVTRFRKGDHVMAVHSAPCLTCQYCRKHLFNLCENIMESKVLGAFADYVLLPGHIVKQNVFHKPVHVSFEEAAFLEPLSCVVHGIGSLNLLKGEHALVFGAGPIGLLHLLLLKEKGVSVTMIDKHRSRLKTAGMLGADFIALSSTSNGSQGNVSNACERKRLTKRTDADREFIGFDYVFECTGTPGVWESSVHYVRRGGTVVLFGGCKSGTAVSYDAGRLHYDEITLKGVFHFTPFDVKNAYRLLCSGKLQVSRLISGTYRLRDTDKAFKKLSKGQGIKYCIVP